MELRGRVEARCGEARCLQAIRLGQIATEDDGSTGGDHNGGDGGEGVDNHDSAYEDEYTSEECAYVGHGAGDDDAATWAAACSSCDCRVLNCVSTTAA